MDEGLGLLRGVVDRTVGGRVAGKEEGSFEEMKEAGPLALRHRPEEAARRKPGHPNTGRAEQLIDELVAAHACRRVHVSELS